MGFVPRCCKHCADWNYAKSTQLAITKPDDYPYTQDPDPNSPKPPPGRGVLNLRSIIPVEMPYTYLLQGSAFCFHNVYHNVWKTKEAKCYLQVLGVQNHHANNNIILAAQTLQEGLPNCIEHMTPPVLWTSGVSLDC